MYNYTENIIQASAALLIKSKNLILTELPPVDSEM